MGNRRRLRLKMVLPIRIWGTDVGGKPFSQLAHTLDLTSSGARVGGMRVLLNSRDVVWVQCRHRKSQFRIVWTGRPGGSRDHQIGIECVEQARNIWGLELDDHAEADPYEAPEAAGESRGKEHRRSTRFPVAGRVDVRNPYASSGGFSAQIGDISMGGCYVQTSTPWPIASPVRLDLHFGKNEMIMRGMVRTYHPDVGMGIEFTEPHTPEDADRFQKFVDSLEKNEAEANNSKAPKPNAIALAGRLTQTTDELRKVEELLKCVDVDTMVLSDFRESLGRVRNTAWALQRWIELQGAERIRLATQLCRALAHELRTTEVKLPDKECRELLASVEDLFTLLAGFDFTVLHDADKRQPEKSSGSSHSATGTSHK